MIFLVHTPAPPLARFIDHLWWLSDAPAHGKEHIVPAGTLELVINLDEDEFRIYERDDSEHCQRLAGAMVSGAYSRYFVIDTREHASIIGVHFKPGGALPFLGVPAGALAATHVELDMLWGPAARELREKLCAAISPERRFDVLERALMQRLSSRFEMRHAAQSGVESLRRGLKVREVAEDLALSQRRFITVFNADIGLTPKLFARITRFQRAFAIAQNASDPDWARLALEAGYFDQSHMIRDFVEFSGFAPTAMRRRRNEPVKDHHVAVPEALGSNSSNTQTPLHRTVERLPKRGGTP
jgi:AraC-like DNA-binding protein